VLGGGWSEDPADVTQPIPASAQMPAHTDNKAPM
jgi:hypothetical protein